MHNRGRLFVLSGPSGVGKGTVLAAWLNRHPQARVSVSATTRAPRPGEIEGTHYFFLTSAQFEQRISSGGMLEWAQYNTNYYGTPRAAVERCLEDGHDVVLEIEVQGAMQVRACMPEAVLIFVMPPSFAELRGRLAGRGTEDTPTISRRLHEAERELIRAGEYDYILVNHTVEQAVEALSSIVEGSKYAVRFFKPFIEEVQKDAKTDFKPD